MFIKGLNWGLLLLIKIARMEWETTSTPYVVNLANQLFHTLEESPKRKTTKILNLQLQQIKAPK